MIWTSRQEFFDAFEQLRIGHPHHVIPVRSLDLAEQLFAEGRLCDESVVIAPQATQAVSNKTRRELKPMELYTLSCILPISPADVRVLR
jgi:hypothetical protein